MHTKRRSVGRTAMITAVSALVLFTTSGCSISDYIQKLVTPCGFGCEWQPAGG